MPVEKKVDDEKEPAPLVPVGDGADESEESLEDQIAKDNAKDKVERGDEGDDGEEAGDERVGHADDDADEPAGESVEQKRERRRAERKRRNQNNQLMKRELSFLRKRNDDVERQLSQVVLRQGQQDIITIDGRIGQIEGQIRQAESVHAAAVESQDGRSATEALRIKDELIKEKGQLEGAKGQRAAQARRDSDGARNSGIDPAVMREATSWVERNADWFDPKLQDETSFLAKSIEDRLQAERKLHPSSPEYWEELDRRIQKRLPEVKKAMRADEDDDLDEEDERPARRASRDDDDDEEEVKPAKKRQESVKKKGSGPRFPVNGRQRALGKDEVFIDAERRKALEDAGLWDDPKTRERYLRSYQKFDKEARSNK